MVMKLVMFLLRIIPCQSLNGVIVRAMPDTHEGRPRPLNPGGVRCKHPVLEVELVTFNLSGLLHSLNDFKG